MSKTMLINLVGASGSGKTTIARLLEETDIKYNVIKSYTTREPRSDDEWGHTFINFIEIIENSWEKTFVYSQHYTARLQPKIIRAYLPFTKMIAYFNSYKSGHHYFATDRQVIRGKTNIYIVDPLGAEMVHEFYKDIDVEVITIYLQVDWEMREYRMEMDDIRFTDTIRERLMSDDELFKVVKCDYVVDGNQDIDMVVNSIRDVIRS